MLYVLEIKMKTLKLLILLIASSVGLSAQNSGTYTIVDGTLGNGNLGGVLVEEGYKVTILGYALRTGDIPLNGPSSRIEVEFQNHSTMFSLTEEVKVVGELVFEGPVTIDARAEGNEDTLAVATVKIERSTPPADIVPHNSVVIPSDSTGPVEVIMERSTDLLNWVEADPGTVDPSAEGVFFRLRVKRN
jgi:hypothetical protein